MTLLRYWPWFDFSIRIAATVLGDVIRRSGEANDELDERIAAAAVMIVSKPFKPEPLWVSVELVFSQPLNVALSVPLVAESSKAFSWLMIERCSELRMNPETPPGTSSSTSYV